MGVGAQDDLKAGLSQAGNGIRRGTSIQSTCPARNAASRVVASGMGKRMSLSTLGMRCLSQYAVNGSSSRARGAPAW